MLLRGLKLKNIRSYKELDLVFHKGKTLFSGDIGCGKSSILMSIEFALFGISSDVDGKTLLRKSCSFGSVELSFFCGGREVVVSRSLKRSQDSVQQGYGFLVVDGSRIDLTPTEIRSRVFELLNYPVVSSGQSKSFLFRFTVYTPQESMRKVLFDSVEDRKSSIRFIFGIDKYKRIRDNVKLLVSFLKSKIAVFEVVSKNLEEKVKEKELVSADIKESEDFLLEKNIFLKSVEANLNESKISLGVYDEKLKEFNSVKNKISGLSGALDQKKNFLKSFKDKLILIDKKLLDCNEISFDSDKVSDFFSYLYFLKSFCDKSSTIEMEDSEKARNNFLNKLSSIKVDVSVCNDKISSAKSVIEKFERNIFSECPLCLSVVDESHKEKIVSSQKKIIDDESDKVGLLNNEMAVLETNVVDIEKKISDLKASESEISGLKQYLVLFDDFGSRLKELNLEFSEKILESLDVNFVLNELKSLKNYFEKVFSSNKEKDVLIDDKKKMTEEIVSLEREISSSENELSDFAKQLEVFVDFEKKFSDEKLKYDHLMKSFSDVKVEISSVSAKLASLKANVSLISIEVDKKKEALESLDIFKSRLSWLQEWFVGLTHSIENQVLYNVFFELNESFKFWFGEIMNSESYDSFLNEDFSVSVLVDGYNIDAKSLSGGEKTACALAYRLAVGNVLSRLNSFVNTEDLLILDEPTDGFSFEQVNGMVDALNKSDFSQIILVSHEKNLESFVDRVVSIKKDNGVSFVT